MPAVDTSAFQKQPTVDANGYPVPDNGQDKLSPSFWGEVKKRFAGSNAGPAFMQSDLVQDPTTGLWVDKNSGIIYSSPDKSRPVSTLNLQQLTTRGTSQSNQLLQQAGQPLQQYNQAVGGEFGLVNSLGDIIAGRGGPSVAATQLGTGLDQVSANQRSLASGASGANAGLANMNAADNIARAQVVANQQQAELRAQEEATARQQQAGVLGNIALGANANRATDIGGSTALSNQDISAGEETQRLKEARDSENKKNIFDTIKGAGAAIGI